MRQKHKFSGLSLALLLTMVLPAVAAPPSSAPSGYDIELLVFENRQPNLEGDELWSQPKLQALAADAAAATMASAAGEDTPLSAAAVALGKNGAFRVLGHYRWSQVPEARSTTVPVRLRSADRNLDGAVRFYLSRFLHVDLDLALMAGTLDLAANVIDPANGTVYRLSEHRRVKSQEVHYFDHPKIGALLRITQASTP